MFLKRSPSILKMRILTSNVHRKGDTFFRLVITMTPPTRGPKDLVTVTLSSYKERPEKLKCGVQTEANTVRREPPSLQSRRRRRRHPLGPTLSGVYPLVVPVLLDTLVFPFVPSFHHFCSILISSFSRVTDSLHFHPCDTGVVIRVRIQSESQGTHNSSSRPLPVPRK